MMQIMAPSSRTPEGWPNRCPVCGKDVCIEPSTPPGDAPCPHCGHLLWFDPSMPEGSDASRGRRCEKLFRAATKLADEGKYDYATDLFAHCVQLDPGNLTYVQNFIDSLRKKYGSKKAIGPMSIFKERGARRALKDAMSHGSWDEALKFGLAVLMVDPWDVSTLTALAESYNKIADARERSRFAECSLFYLQCAEDAGR
jgi:hypothetical protein